jgi:putative ABC transport system permease protein
MLRRIRSLDRKLLRDLWAMKGQALAIASVIGAGVTMFVTYLSNFDSLQRTRQGYYERARFADVFAGAKRVPTASCRGWRRFVACRPCRRASWPM